MSLLYDNPQFNVNPSSSIDGENFYFPGFQLYGRAILNVVGIFMKNFPISSSLPFWVAAGLLAHGVTTSAVGEVIYNVDFSAPEHSVGSLPATGDRPKMVSHVVFGTPTVRQASGVMTDRPLEFDAVASYEQIVFGTPKTAASYDIECDVAGHALRDSKYTFTLMLETPTVRTVDFHGALNTISVFQPHAAGVGNSVTLQDDRIYHLAVHIDLENNAWQVSVNDTEIYSHTIDATQMSGVVFTLSPAIEGTGNAAATKVALDNVLITATGTFIPPPPVLHLEPFPAPRTSTVTFDGEPVQPRDAQYGISSYIEAGFVFKPLGPIDANPPYRLIRNGGGILSYPENGSAYLQLFLDSSLEIYESSDRTFQPISVDLAEYSTVFPIPKAVGFRGVKANGDEVTTEFVTDGVIDGAGSSPDFQRFIFPSTFTDIVRLKATATGFSMDNLEIQVPAPATTPQPSMSNPTPAEVDRINPRLTVFGSSKLRVQSRFVFLKGAVADNREIKLVEIQTGNGPFQRANRSGGRWSQTLILPTTRTVFHIRAIDAAGNLSPAKRVIVTRQSP